MPQKLRATKNFFCESNDEKDGKHNQIRLSAFAKQIIEDDILNFNLVPDPQHYLDALSGKNKAKTHFMQDMINNIISKFYPTANASISRRLDDAELAIRKWLKTRKKLADDQRERIATSLLFYKKQELTEKKDRYPAPLPVKSGAKGDTDRRDQRIQINLNKENHAYLNGECSDCREAEYYGHKRSSYIRALCEEYASLSTVERERLMFADRIKKVDDAVNNGTQLLLQTTAPNSTKGGNLFIMTPYKVMPDSNHNHNYIVGYVRKQDAPNTLPYICPFRLDGLRQIRLGNKQGNGLTEEQKNAIERRIVRTDVPFCLEEAKQIKVKLTDEGIKKYSRSAHPRPTIKFTGKKDDSAEGIYMFECTVSQARFYFQSFGKEAIILAVESPVYGEKGNIIGYKPDEKATRALQKTFLDFHETAINAYKELLEETENNEKSDDKDPDMKQETR